MPAASGANKIAAVVAAVVGGGGAVAATTIAAAAAAAAHHVQGSLHRRLHSLSRVRSQRRHLPQQQTITYNVTYNSVDDTALTVLFGGLKQPMQVLSTVSTHQNGLQ
jgi:hypothetical protein